ncbi:unnamed protein product, partial [Caretta caretta]
MCLRGRSTPLAGLIGSLGMCLEVGDQLRKELKHWNSQAVLKIPFWQRRGLHFAADKALTSFNAAPHTLLL